MSPTLLPQLAIDSDGAIDRNTDVAPAHAPQPLLRDRGWSTPSLNQAKEVIQLEEWICLLAF
jgi:hypothetical protein